MALRLAVGFAALGLPTRDEQVSDQVIASACWFGMVRP